MHNFVFFFLFFLMKNNINRTTDEFSLYFNFDRRNYDTFLFFGETEKTERKRQTLNTHNTEKRNKKTHSHTETQTQTSRRNDLTGTKKHKDS